MSVGDLCSPTKSGKRLCHIGLLSGCGSDIPNDRKSSASPIAVGTSCAGLLPSNSNCSSVREDG